ncbi:hypothetical protein Tco_0861784, partial [Tanacetum coccineum]
MRYSGGGFGGCEGGEGEGVAAAVRGVDDDDDGVRLVRVVVVWRRWQPKWRVGCGLDAMVVIGLVSGV